MAKLQSLLTELDQALGHLDVALQRTGVDNLVRAGCIQYFDFYFEIAWKALQTFFREQGLPECYSPKNCFQQAFKVGLIQEETPWHQMLQDRNRTVHTYDYEFSLEVYDRLSKYVVPLRQLQLRLAAQSGE